MNIVAHTHSLSTILPACIIVDTLTLVFFIVAELVFLYTKYDEWDSAALTMMSHSADSWDHVVFKDTISKVTNIDLCYRAVEFYIAEHPTLVNDLMPAMVSKVDHTRVVQLIRRSNQLPLLKPYLVAVQEVSYPGTNYSEEYTVPATANWLLISSLHSHTLELQKNIAAVNEALNEILIEEGDHEALKNSIDHFDNFDKIALGQQLEKHDLLEFRRIAAHIYKVCLGEGEGEGSFLLCCCRPLSML